MNKDFLKDDHYIENDDYLNLEIVNTRKKIIKIGISTIYILLLAVSLFIV